MTSEPLATLVRSKRWFHAIDFGDGVISPGRAADDTPPNYTLYGVFELLRHIELRGLKVVDVGTMDGLVAFIMKRRGASSVIATDLAPRETFVAGRDTLGLDIDYRVPAEAIALPEIVGEPRADLIVMAGVLYHVFDPIAVLEACRRALRRGGLLLVETSYLFDEPAARMSFSPADDTARGIERPNVFWRPSRRALEGMLRLVGFEVLATVAVDGRLTALGEARRPREINERPRTMRDFHGRYMRYPHYREHIDLEALWNDDAPRSPIRYRGPRGTSRLYPALYRPDVPLQPAWSIDRDLLRYAKVGQSAWFHARSLLGEARAALRAAVRRGKPL